MQNKCNNCNMLIIQQSAFSLFLGISYSMGSFSQSFNKINPFKFESSRWIKQTNDPEINEYPLFAAPKLFGNCIYVHQINTQRIQYYSTMMSTKCTDANPIFHGYNSYRPSRQCRVATKQMDH